MAYLRLKRLAMILESLQPHPSPSPMLEQYTIGGEDAARLLWIIKEDLKDKVVVDLGCGTGRLSIGSILVGAAFAVGVDADEAALRIAHENAEKVDMGSLTSWIQAYVPYVATKADVVI